MKNKSNLSDDIEEKRPLLEVSDKESDKKSDNSSNKPLLDNDSFHSASSNSDDKFYSADECCGDKGKKNS